MKIKNYDEKTGKWIVTASNEADSIELVNPSFTSEAGGPVSVSEAFTQVGERLTTLEQNVIWLYKNKGTGSGSGGSGGGSGSGSSANYTITVMNGDTVYTSTSSVSLDLLINSGGTKKSFTVVAKNRSTKKTIGTYKVYSMTQTEITLSGLDGTTNVEISAYDSDNIYATPVYITVIAGAVKLELANTPPKTIYMSSTAAVTLNYTVSNSITGSAAAFYLFVNNKEVEKVENITTSSRSIMLDAREILFESGNFTPRSGQKFTFKAYATTTLNGETLTSNISTFSVSVADGNNLTIVVDGITEDEPTIDSIVDLTSFNQGSQLGFDYYLSCAITKYTTFNIDYVVELMEIGNSEPIETLTSGTRPNIPKGSDERFNLSTVEFEPTNASQYLRITLSGSATNDPGAAEGQDTKYVYCTIAEMVSVDLYANNDKQTLLAYFSRISGFPNNPTGTWNYKPKTSGQFEYTGSYSKLFKDGVNLTSYKVNGVTSGYVNTGEGVNITPAIAYAGEAYGTIDAGSILFPDLDIFASSSIFAGTTGFNISTTFKTNENGSTEDVILSLGKYENDILITGYEISYDLVTCKMGASKYITAKLPTNTLTTVDLDVEYMSGGWYFKIYINGVMSAVMRIEDRDNKRENIDWLFGTDIYLGCRYDNGVTSRYSGVNIYDFKIYTSTISEYAITQNYISATCQAQLYNEAVNPTLDSELRIKNLFDAAGNCIIWDKTNNDYYSGDQLYNKLVDQMEINTPYPLVLIEETSNVFTNFQPYSTAVFGTEQKAQVMADTYGCKITYQDAKGKAVISTPDGVASTSGVRIGLQGTSSLSYTSKNYEIYLGDKDAEGNPLLFTPSDDWLPENEFTLKADVMDSAHVNNVVIGKIVNGWATGVTGNVVKPFDSTPPMQLGNAVWGDAEKAEKVRDKFKHTSEGFPVLLFIRYAPDKDGNTQEAQFMGIYNFNLGRYAYNNLGMKLLLDYEKQNQDGPSLVTDYTLKEDYWNKGTTEGVYSMEINQNSSSQGAFQQDDPSIIRYMADVAYSSRGEQDAYNKVQYLYTQLANMALSDVQKYTMSANGKTFEPIPGEFYVNNKNEWYNFDAFNGKMYYNNAVYYYTLALVFGMVDSMCKNLTLRNWGNDQWYTCFYDMDTAFGLNNAGQDIVTYYAHLHRWYNQNDAQTGLTESNIEKNYWSADDAAIEVKQFFSSWWNRIWEVLENLGIQDPAKEDNYRLTIDDAYANLRNNLFPDPEQFINDYYKSYTDATGSIVFNYDYRVKYLKIAQDYDLITGEYTDSTDFSQLSFLHGNRVIHVKDWFKKRIYFLDSVYGGLGEGTINAKMGSPVTDPWAENKATGSATTKIEMDMSGSSKVLYKYGFDKLSASFWIDENDQEIVHLTPNGETIISMYANKFIKNISNFKQFNWTKLDNINLPLLEELDLSNMKNVDSSTFFGSGVYSKAEDRGLKSIKKLNLSGVKFLPSTTSTAISYTLGLTDCEKLKELDVSNSDITSISYPSSAVLKSLNLSGTNITKLNLADQSFLTYLGIDNCAKLTEVTITNCESLPTINIPSSVTKVTISNCAGLETFSLPYTGASSVASNLTYIQIDNCPNLKIFDISNQNNPNLVVDLVGAKGLEELNLSGTQFSALTLPPLKVNDEPYFCSLKSINIANTTIDHFEYNDSITEGVLDLTNFPDLSNLYCYSCNNLKVVKLPNNPDNPIELMGNSFTSCTSLERVYGHVSLLGTYVFDKCAKFKINDEEVYSRNGYDYSVFFEGDDVTNITILTNSLEGMFNSCANLTYDDFRYIMRKGTTDIKSAKNTFNGCTNIEGPLRYDIFKYMPNLTTVEGMLAKTSINGAVLSRYPDDTYNKENTSTWGVFDFIPLCTDFTSFLNASKVEYIDNRIFQPTPDGVAFSGTKIDSMFSGCGSLIAVADTRGDKTPKPLSSSTFFVNLNLTDIYPSTVFAGTGIQMTIDEDSEGNTLLFHTRKNATGNQTLTNELYKGVDLIGEIKENVFGGVSNKIGNYNIPKFQGITDPFGDVRVNIQVDLSKMSNMFKGFNNILTKASGIFDSVTLIGEKKIPSDLFKGCTALVDVSNFFANLTFDYGSDEFEFPVRGMFDDCEKLANISGILQGCYNNKIKLIGGQFKNCKLTNVSNAFNTSGIYGFVPYKLFYMAGSDGTIRSTISDMTGIFKNCYYLGFDKTRVISTENYNTTQTLRYTDHVTSEDFGGNPGKVLTFKLEEIDETDDWCLDGYGAEGASDTFKTLVADYIKYDEQQKAAIAACDSTGQGSTSVQNYMVPTDIFRYCSATCDLSGILQDLSWNVNTIELSDKGTYQLVTKDEVEGLTGRLPMRLFESLTSATSLAGVLQSVQYEPFVGLNPSTETRGIMYPPDLFKHNTSLTDVSSCLAGRDIVYGCDINADLFENNTKLSSISSLWADCDFDGRSYESDTKGENPQITWTMFKANTMLKDCSYLFSVNTQTGIGVRYMSSQLLADNFNISNIAGMFYNNARMKGSVPTFKFSSYKFLSSGNYNDYLRGVSKGNIDNVDSIQSELLPEEWR